jgi:competence protein ComEC
MYPDRILFFLCLGFLLGNFTISTIPENLFIFSAALGAAVCLFLAGYKENWKILGGLILVGGFLLGGFHNLKQAEQFASLKLPENLENLPARVVSSPYVKNTTQRFLLEFETGFKLLIYTSPYPQFKYGEILEVSGVVENLPRDGYGKYLEKMGASGSMFFPEIKNLEKREVGFRGWLYDLRGLAEENIRRVLPFQEAALLNGLVFGNTEEFSEEFKESMQKSGTTHLTALSGYNIAVVAEVALAFFILFFRRRLAVLGAGLAITAFVLMTGAEPSVVRAALMGGLVLLAKESGRLYDLKNAIALVAALMVFFNPKLLVYDLGFQLSFLALLGIVYLSPALAKLFKWQNPPTGGKPNSFKDLFLSSVSAQLAVAPLLLYQFGFVSWFGIAVNLLVLPLIPFVMGIGFLSAGLGFLGLEVFAWLAWPVLFFIRKAIEIGSAPQVFIFQPAVWHMLVYWSALIVFIGVKLKERNVGDFK